MNLAAGRCFRNADKVTDRFHVQPLAFDAVQELRIQYRCQVLEQENEAQRAAKANGVVYEPEVLANGDTLKQLLARSRYVLFKSKDKWTGTQKQRAQLLFERYPAIRQAYKLASKLGTIYRTCTSKEQAFKKLALWYNEVESAGLPAFNTVARTIETHYLSILNFFKKQEYQCTGRIIQC